MHTSGPDFPDAEETQPPGSSGSNELTASQADLRFWALKSWNHSVRNYKNAWQALGLAPCNPSVACPPGGHLWHAMLLKRWSSAKTPWSAQSISQRWLLPMPRNANNDDKRQKTTATQPGTGTLRGTPTASSTRLYHKNCYLKGLPKRTNNWFARASTAVLPPLRLQLLPIPPPPSELLQIAWRTSDATHCLTLPLAFDHHDRSL